MNELDQIFELNPLTGLWTATRADGQFVGYLPGQVAGVAAVSLATSENMEIEADLLIRLEFPEAMENEAIQAANALYRATDIQVLRIAANGNLVFA